MGVKGLQTFVNNHQQFFESHQLHSTKVVIDGYGVMSKFYFAQDVDPGNHGGEFQNFYSYAAHIFGNLALCGIQPYVIFDGGYDLDGKKFETMKERCRQKINTVNGIIHGRRGFLMPTLSSEVLKKVLRDLKIPFVFGDFEADRDIAVLANELCCPVLGQDSDFLIMDIHQGYIPFDTLEWEQVSSSQSNEPRWRDGEMAQDTQSAPGRKFIRCQRYRLNKFCEYFQVDACLMPLFASLSGNDYLQSISLKGFFGATKNIYQHRPDGNEHILRKGNYKFCELLYHLTFYKSLPDCLNEVVKHVSPNYRSKVGAALKTSCDMYDVHSPSPICDYFRSDGGENLMVSPLVTKHGIPAPFLRLLHRGEVPTMPLNLYLNRMYFVGTQIEDLSEVRSSACADTLMSLLCGIMLMDVAQEHETNGRALTVDIYDRDEMNLKCYKVDPQTEVHGFGPVLSFKRMPHTSQHQRKLFFLAVLEAKEIHIDKIPTNFHLALLVTLYWFKRAQPSVNKRHVCALVLGWIQGVAWCKHNAWRLRICNQEVGFDKEIHWPDSEVISVLQNFESLTKRSRSKGLDLNACHAFAQWVSCYRVADYINAVLSLVFPRSDMTVLFNGLLLHNLFFRLNELHPDHHQEWFANSLFLHAPCAHGLFHNLMEFFDRNIIGRNHSEPARYPDPGGRKRGRNKSKMGSESGGKRGPGRGGNRGRQRGGMRK